MKLRSHKIYNRSLISALLLVWFIAFSTAHAQINLTNGLWAYYGFNDGTASNNTAGGPVGTIVGNLIVTNGWFQKALQFDGISNSVNMGGVGYFSSVTVSAYVMIGAPLSPGAEQQIVNHSQGYEDFTLSVTQTNGTTTFTARYQPRYFYYGYGWLFNEVRLKSLTSPVVGKIYHVAITFDGVFRLYINGIKEAELDQGVNGVGYYYYWRNANLSIGSKDGSDNFFNGIIDEVYIYTRALSVEEIRQLETPPLPPYITTQPIGLNVALGSNALFNVSATAQGALPLFYQWQRNGTNLIGSSNLVGVSSSTLIISNLQSTNLGFYSVVVTNISGSVTSSAVLLGISDTLDNDHDGIPNWWESLFGLNPNNSSDANNHPPGDQLTYLQKYLYGLDPLILDTDGDGLSDYDELYVYGTDPRKSDTEGDGVPDGWEIQHGLNPLSNDASRQSGFIGVSNLQIYQYNLVHTSQLDPR